MIRIQRPACPNPKALNTNYKHPDNKNALRESAFDKCMYCESKITHIDFADVEHIRPKESSPTLEFAWDNLGYACSKCNNEKRAKYNAATPYINPYAEEPNEHLYAFGAMLRPKNGSERGELTIEDINLNRPELLERRDARIKELHTSVVACYRTQNEQLRENALTALREQGMADKEYSIFANALLNSHESE